MISVCIPVHEMEGGSTFLTRSFEALKNQSYKNFEVVVTDNSDDDNLKKICDIWKQHLVINYFKNPRKGMAQNTNEAIKKSKGNLIKILYMDDYLAHEDALRIIAEAPWGKRYWLVSGCEHTVDGVATYNPHLPIYNQQIKDGVNTIGSPSVLTISKNVTLRFDEKMTWLLDCDYYKRLGKIYGPPIILNDLNVVIGVGRHQATNLLSDELKVSEQEYLMSKNV